MFEESVCKLISTYLGPIRVTNEVWIHEMYIHMIISHNSSGLSDDFRDGIRARDGKCVITGVEKNTMVLYGIWSSFEAAHTPFLWQTRISGGGGITGGGSRTWTIMLDRR